MIKVHSSLKFQAGSASCTLFKIQTPVEALHSRWDLLEEPFLFISFCDQFKNCSSKRYTSDVWVHSNLQTKMNTLTESRFEPVSAVWLQRMFSVDQESADSIEQEIRVLKQLNGHPNVIEFCASAAADSQGGRREYFILTELCPGGVVVDAVNKVHFNWTSLSWSIFRHSNTPQFNEVTNCFLAFLEQDKLSVEQVLRIFYQCCRAVLHMHTQQPPITHRDLKLENLLIAKDGTVKLCDFGSSTSACHLIDDKWTALKRSLVEDEVFLTFLFIYRI